MQELSCQCNHLHRYIIACLLISAFQTAHAVMQELAAQGKLPPGKVMSFAKPGEDTATICRDVYINDASPDMRHHMTKRPTQDDVARRTGTQVRAKPAPALKYCAPSLLASMHVQDSPCQLETLKQRVAEGVSSKVWLSKIPEHQNVEL